MLVFYYYWYAIFINYIKETLQIKEMNSSNIGVNIASKIFRIDSFILQFKYEKKNKEYIRKQLLFTNKYIVQFTIYYTVYISASVKKKIFIIFSNFSILLSTISKFIRKKTRNSLMKSSASSLDFLQYIIGHILVIKTINGV